MNQNQQQGSFFDSKTILAIILVGLVFFGWQSYISKKYPQQTTEQTATDAATSKAATSDAPAAATKGSDSVVSAPSPQANQKAASLASSAAEEKWTSFETEQFRARVSSYGMSLSDVQLKAYTDRDKKQIQLLQPTGSFLKLSLLGSGQALNFQQISFQDNKLVGTAKLGDLEVQEELLFDSIGRSFQSKIRIRGMSADQKGLMLSVSDVRIASSGGSFLAPAGETQSFAITTAGKTEHLRLQNGKELAGSYPAASLLGLGTHYFAAAIVDKSAVVPAVKVDIKAEDTLAHAQFLYTPADPRQEWEISLTGYMGPKSVSFLEKTDSQLVNLVDYGFFSSIAKILLVVLNWFYSFVKNWGVAIILLTLLARAIVLPFNIMSFKSMKKMQKIQPMIQALRERYKDDPTTLNREMMVLMKEHKVNPVGGCLPTLLQLPIFLALFQVLNNSIELYQAPFMLWIHDLSVRDPFFIFPVLMGITMYFQQKLTPTTMDPAQAKVMQFMPILFSVMTVSLPSGLTLYIFVSTLFGVVQQALFLREKQTSIEVKAVRS